MLTLKRRDNDDMAVAVTGGGEGLSKVMGAAKTIFDVAAVCAMIAKSGASNLVGKLEWS